MKREQKTSIPVSQQSLYDWHVSSSFFTVGPSLGVNRYQSGWVHQHQRQKSRGTGDLSKVLIFENQNRPTQTMAEHIAHKAPEMFKDRMIMCPFAHWEHQHCFVAQGQSHPL